MTSERLPDHLLLQGYTSERENARLNLQREVEFATQKLQELARELRDCPDGTVFSGRARQLGATVAELLTRAGELDMANRLAFLRPNDPEEG
ncbi:hypothetical protein [Nonomuraea pusilla]|uniref:Uncharacterized protein n=1 Tax=Nonomuraea pusilla TaxID=46177 RepID=A0A1H8K7D7_9ACTN|nr:hypothetical protein [Nonomuraea pusilla]SEN88328.1 hypothetical protein SAMN05660976_08532 [Nonomuraea pusilla]